MEKVTIYSELIKRPAFIDWCIKMGHVSVVTKTSMQMYERFFELGDIPKMMKYSIISEEFGYNEKVVQRYILRLSELVHPVSSEVQKP